MGTSTVYKYLGFSFLLTMLLGVPRLVKWIRPGNGKQVHEDEPERIPGPEIGDYLGLPINDAARMRADSWAAPCWSCPRTSAGRTRPICVARAWLLRSGRK